MSRGAAVLVVALASLGLSGCPADDMPPLPTPSRPGVGPTPTPTTTPSSRVDASKETSPVTDPARASSSDRDRLLAMTPAEALADGLRGAAPGGLSPLLAGEGALAMAEQLRAAAAPIQALELCVVAFDRAREQAAPSGTLPAPALDHLQRSLKVQAGDQPALLRWVEALAARVYLRQDLEAALAFLVKVREVYSLGSALPKPR